MLLPTLTTVHQLSLGKIVGANDKYKVVRMRFHHTCCVIMDITYCPASLADKTELGLTDAEIF